MLNFTIKEDERNMNRDEMIAEQNAIECLDEITNEFDWDRYQYLCDCGEYWNCEE